MLKIEKNIMLKIEKNIPVPPKTHRAASSKYPWRQMVVGDSFLVPLAGKHPMRVQATICTSVARLKPKLFTTSQVDGGIRVWRTG
jgi:hypothetical protein